MGKIKSNSRLEDIVKKTLKWSSEHSGALLGFSASAAYLTLSNDHLFDLGNSVLCGGAVYAGTSFVKDLVDILTSKKNLTTKLKDITYWPIDNPNKISTLIGSTYFYKLFNSVPDNVSDKITSLSFLPGLCLPVYVTSKYVLNFLKYSNKKEKITEKIRKGSNEKTNLSTKLGDWVIEHRELTSLLVGSQIALFGIGGGYLPPEYSKLSKEILLNHEMLGHFSFIIKNGFFLSCAMVGSMSSYALLNLFKSYKSPVIKNSAKFLAIEGKTTFKLLGAKNKEEYQKLTREHIGNTQLIKYMYRDMSLVTHDLAVSYLQLNEYDTSLKYFKESFKQFSPKNMKKGQFTKIQKYLANPLVKFNRKFQNETGSKITDAFDHLRYLNPKKSFDCLGEMVDGDYSPETNFICALFWDMINEKYEEYYSLLPKSKKKEFNKELIVQKTNKQWEKTIKLVLSNPGEYQRELIGETKNIVFEIKNKNYFKDSFVMKGGGNKEELLGEIKNTKKLEEITRDYPKFIVPKPLNLTNEKIKYDSSDGHKEIFVYTMQRKDGKTLMELIENGEEPFEHFKKVVEYLSLIHAKMPIDGRDKLDYYGKLKRVLGEVKEIDGDLKKLILDNVSPVINSFDNAILVFNKDAHPQNWLITEYDEVVSIDIENKGIVPIEFDLVNLMEYSGFLINNKFGDEKRREIMESYKENYIKYSGDNTAAERINEFRYWNSVIQRTLSLYSAWSSPLRESLWEDRKIIVNNALHAIDNLSMKHPAYFHQNNKQYNNLEMAFEELKSIV